MTLSDKKEETCRVAADILNLGPDQVDRVFYQELKRRRLTKLVRSLDKLVADGGDDGRLAARALIHLGFPVL